MGQTRFLFNMALLAVLVGVYINWPAPEMSTTMMKWLKRGKHYTHQGKTIFYMDGTNKEKESGPTLLLLHGYPTSSYDWIQMWPALKEKFRRIIAPDFYGLGFSDKPSFHHYTIVEQADIVEGLLVQLDVTDTHVLSHDYGDTVAQELLARFEDRKAASTPGLQLHSLCLLNGGIFPETHNASLAQRVMAIPVLGQVLSRIAPSSTFKVSFARVFGPDTQPDVAELNDWWALMRYNHGNLVTHEILQYMSQRRANRGRWVGALQTTTIPVHTIYGPEDVINPRPFIKYFQETVPRAGITVLEGLGHYPHWEGHKQVSQAYFDFLKKDVPYT